MKKNIKYIICAVLIMIFAFGYAHIDKSVPIYDTDVDSSEYIKTGVIGTDTVTQKFLCVENKMDGVKLKNIIYGDLKGKKLQYKLIDKSSGEVLREGEKSIEKAKVTALLEIEFETVANTKNKTFEITLNSVDKNQENGIGIAYTPKKMKENVLFINGESTEGTMILKTITKRFDLETFVVTILFVTFISSFFMYLYKLFSR